MTSPAKERLCVQPTLLTGVIAVEALSARSYGRHIHDEFGIGIVLAGAHDSASGRGPVRARSGHLISVNPGEVHDGVPVGGAPRRWRMLYFQPPSLAAAFSGLGVSTGTELSHPVLDDHAAARSYLSLHAAVTGPAMSALGVESLLLETLCALLDAPARRPAPGRDAIAPARKRIDDDPANELRLEQLATACGLSLFRFLRAFRAATGLPPHAYRIQRRLHLARRLIAGGLPVSDAAVAAGFADQAHLHRHFRRAYGYTPGALARVTPTRSCRAASR